MSRSTQSDPRFEALAESAPDAILTIDEESTILFANTAVERVFGYAPGELIGQSLLMLIPERLRESHNRGLARYLKSGRKNIPWTGVSLPGLRKDGSELPVEISFGEFVGEDGSRAFSGFVRDISDRVRAREQIEDARASAEAALAELRRISSVIDAALARSTYDQMVKELLHRLRKELGAQSATMLLLDEARGELVVRASDDEDVVASDDGRRIAIGTGVSGTVAQTARPLVIDDMSTVSTPSERFRGLGSAIAVPTIAEGKVVGVLHVGAVDKGHFKPDDLRLLEIVGDRVAGVLARTRLFEELQRLRDASERHAQDERVLRTLAQGITSAVTIEQVMQQMAEGSLTIAGATMAFVEQIVPPAREVVVVAAAGAPTFDVGMRAAFPGSLTDEIIEGAAPVFLPGLEGLGASMAPRVEQACPGCSALVMPILAHGQVLGALVLLRPAEGGPFEDRIVNRVRTLGELASLSLHRLEALAESERRRREAEQAVRTRDEVLSVVSHDLRNPLGTVMMAASLLRDRDIPLAEEQRNMQLEIINRSAHRMNRLIQDLLDVARIEGKRFTIERRCEVPRVLATEACESFQIMARAKSQTLTCVLDEDVPNVMVDRDRVLQVLSNYLNNALKFTPQGGSVMVRVRRSEIGVRFAIEDSGPGIAAEDLGHVFERFWQSQRTAHMGSGLGLAIALGIAEAHGGRVGVDSVAGQGSTFWLDVPAAPDC